jgi:signal transduction histidine kinase
LESLKQHKQNKGLLLFFWTLIVLLSITWNFFNNATLVKEHALTSARAHFSKDSAFRYWGAKHGGVYVPPTAETPPNPALKHIHDRDIVTLKGKKLTLMNPAYMVRQLMDDYSELYGVKGRITSFKLLNPNNAPDDWEKDALFRFEDGLKEKLHFTTIEGKPYLRLMRPLYTKISCLKCHGHQNYKVGDIRGGMGLNLPLTPYYNLRNTLNKNVAVSHLILFVLGISIIIIFSKKNKQWVLEREERAKQKDILHQQIVDAEKASKESNLQLIAINDELSKFTHIVSHDLKAPLRGVSSLITWIEEDHGAVLDSKGLEKMNLVKERVGYMAKLIEELLEYSSVSHEMDEREPINCNQLIKDVTQQLYIPKHINLTVETLPTLLGSRILLHQLFQNLISNAIKYMDKENGFITISSKDEEGFNTLCIADNGQGIHPMYFSKIFGLFQKLHSNSQGESSTGIGLALVKKVVTSMNGKVWVESELGQGSQFYIQFPTDT